MQDDLEKLKEIGAQQIHNDTFISKDYVQAIIHGSFDGMGSVQLMGFISILERHYNVDLSELRQKAKAHYKDAKSKILEPEKVFVGTRRKQDNSKIYILLALAVFASAAYYNFVYVAKEQTQIVQNVENEVIENLKKNIEVKTEQEQELSESAELTQASENNETQEDANISNVLIAEAQSMQEQGETKEDEAILEPAQSVERTLKVLPKNKLWAGYINIETNQKYQGIYKEELPIEADKNWLLLFGPGTVNLEVNGEVKSFSSDQNMRFKYVDGVFEKISITEFKSLNKGRKW